MLQQGNDIEFEAVMTRRFRRRSPIPRSGCALTSLFAGGEPSLD